MKLFFWVSGATIIILVIIIVLAAQLYPKHLACQEAYNFYGNQQAPEASQTPTSPEWMVLADCHGVENDLSISYYLIAIGVALLAIGFVIRN